MLPRSLPFGVTARFVAWTMTTLLTVAGGWYSLKARVDSHESAIVQLQQTTTQVNESRGDMKAVITRIDALDRRLSDTREETLKRLDRIEANQMRERP